ncbi:MAG TPA: DUF3443 family protein [Terriglobia bacterium]|nr:DUF3443 family protein [Terriglobia bacterium]
MTPRKDLSAILGRFLVVVMALIFICSCGGGNTPVPTPTTPAASLSATSLTFISPTVGTPSAAQTVTLNSTGSGTLTLSAIATSGDFAQTNNCATSLASGASCAISVIFTPTASGTRTGALTVTDNAGNSPQTVSLSGSAAASTVSLSTSTLAFAQQVMVGTPSPSQSVTLTDIGIQALTITNISVTGDFSQTNTCGSGVSAGGSCTITVTLTPTAVGAATGTLTITDDSNGVAGTTQTVALTGSGFSDNAVDVNVNFGPNGNSGPPTATTSSYYNGIFTTVTICAPGTTTCATISNVLVDTGSIGLRVLSDQMGSVTLPAITDSNNNPLYECVEYGDTSYNWGPVQLATVQIGGETASETPGQTANSGVPIQVITANATAPSVAPCTSGLGPSDSTVALLGANGILGVANYAQDCGGNCTSSTTSISPYPYLVCTSTLSSCQLTAVPLENQVWNPVSAFASADTNGVILQLPSIPPAGQATVAGTLVFGIETETCPGSPQGCFPNTLGTAQLYALDQNGSFPTIDFNGVTYNSSTNPSYLDSGSEAFYISDHTTLGISDCMIGTTDIGYYCPASTLNIPNIGLTGLNGVGSGTVFIAIANALGLFNSNPSFAAFNDLGGDSGTGAANDSFDFGLPFFFGRNVYVGIMGTTTPNGASAPNGYYAF